MNRESLWLHYRKAISPETSCAEIDKYKGIQFDPEVVDAFFRVRKRQPGLFDSTTPIIQELPD